MNDIEYLVNSYFNNDKAFSKVTSSHWQKYGKLQKVTFKKPQAKMLNVSKREVISETVSNIKLSGGGFGDYKKLTLGNLLINIPIFVYLIFNSWLKLRLKHFIRHFFTQLNRGKYLAMM